MYPFQILEKTSFSHDADYVLLLCSLHEVYNMYYTKELLIPARAISPQIFYFEANKNRAIS